MQPGWCQPVRQEFMENECEALPCVAYPGVRDNRSTVNTKTGYDDDDPHKVLFTLPPCPQVCWRAKSGKKVLQEQHSEGEQVKSDPLPPPPRFYARFPSCHKRPN